MSGSFDKYEVNVTWFVSYPPRHYGSKERKEACSLIRALKHIGGSHGDSYRLSKQSRLDTKNAKQALDWFGSVSAMILKIQRPVFPIVFVPIPDSDCILSDSRIPRTYRLAEAIANRMAKSAAVSDALRWRHQQTPSHNGGTRDSARLLRELELVSPPDAGTVILVDDVLTTGAHILASAARLRSAGFNCRNAICVARTEPIHNPRTFGIRHTALLG